MSSSNNQSSSVVETALKVAGAIGGLTTAMLAVYYAIAKPKITGWIQECCIGASGFIFDPEDQISTEILVKVTVSNHRLHQGAIAEWVLMIEGDDRQHRETSIPPTCGISRPGFGPDLKPIRETEQPLIDLRALASQPFKTASGWLRFVFPGTCISLTPRVVLIAVDHLHRKHSIKGTLPYDGGLAILE
jgi:hypothetical protein